MRSPTCCCQPTRRWPTRCSAWSAKRCGRGWGRSAAGRWARRAGRAADLRAAARRRHASQPRPRPRRASTPARDRGGDRLPPGRRPAAAGGAVRPGRGDRRHRVCLPAIEVLDSRFTDPDAQDKLALLADSSTHGGFVFGAPAANWQGIDFARETVRVLVDGAGDEDRHRQPGGRHDPAGAVAGRHGRALGRRAAGGPVRDLRLVDRQGFRGAGRPGPGGVRPRRRRSRWSSRHDALPAR